MIFKGFGKGVLPAYYYIKQKINFFSRAEDHPCFFSSTFCHALCCYSESTCFCTSKLQFLSLWPSFWLILSFRVKAYFPVLAPCTSDNFHFDQTFSCPLWLISSSVILSHGVFQFLSFFSLAKHCSFCLFICIFLVPQCYLWLFPSFSLFPSPFLPHLSSSFLFGC